MSKQVKMVLLGHSSTGKTSIVHRLLHNNFLPDSESTIGASFATLKFNDVIYQIWEKDIQKRYKAMFQMYTRNAKIVIFVFDLTNMETINRFDTYLKDSKNYLDDKFKVIIVGNKMDLFSGNLDLVHKFINDKLETYNNLKDRIVYIGTSAKSGLNIDLLKEKIDIFGKQIKQKYDIENKDLIRTYKTDQINPQSTKCEC